MKHRLPLILCLLLALPVRAGLLETELQHRVRYGAPVESLDDTVSPILHGAVNKTYHYRNWIIRVAYADHRALRMLFRKNGRTPSERRINESDIRGILSAEKNQGSWRPDHSDRNPYSISLMELVAPVEKWISDKGSTACLIEKGTVLILDTPQSRDFHIRS
jgi:hypothetical protein